jgi:hypothetical protein
MNEEKYLFYRLDYVDFLGDVYSALMLSRIVHWYSPSSKAGQSKTWVHRQGKWWVVQSTQEWKIECFLNRGRSTRCLKLLASQGIIETELFKFDGAPTTHIRLIAAGGEKIVSSERLTVEQLVGIF